MLNVIEKNMVNSNSAADLGAEAKKNLKMNKAPQAFISTTKLAAAEQKANPRPPSSMPGKSSTSAMNQSSDEYSDDAYEQNDFEDDNDGAEDKKIAKLREKIKRDN